MCSLCHRRLGDNVRTNQRWFFPSRSVVINKCTQSIGCRAQNMPIVRLCKQRESNGSVSRRMNARYFSEWYTLERTLWRDTFSFFVLEYLIYQWCASPCNAFHFLYWWSVACCLQWTHSYPLNIGWIDFKKLLVPSLFPFHSTSKGCLKRMEENSLFRPR